MGLSYPSDSMATTCSFMLGNLFMEKSTFLMDPIGKSSSSQLLEIPDFTNSNCTAGRERGFLEKKRD